MENTINFILQYDQNKKNILVIPHGPKTTSTQVLRNSQSMLLLCATSSSSGVLHHAASQRYLNTPNIRRRRGFHRATNATFVFLTDTICICFGTLQLLCQCSIGPGLYPPETILWWYRLQKRRNERPVRLEDGFWTNV